MRLKAYFAMIKIYMILAKANLNHSLHKSKDEF